MNARTPSATLAAASVLAAVAVEAADITPANLRWEQTAHSLALRHGEVILWKFSAGPDDAKPSFHPIALPDGTLLTNQRDPDHPWHRGWWFTFHTVNRVDFWAENAQTGVMGTSRIRVAALELEPRDDFSARLRVGLEYERLNGPPMIREDREILVTAPDRHGGFSCSSRHRFTALVDTTIENYFYGGIGVRLGKDLRKGWRTIDAAGTPLGRTENAKQLTAPPTPWVAYVHEHATGYRGVALMDHPANPGHPRQWFCSPNYPFIALPFAYPETVQLPQNQTYTVRYRLLIFAGQPSLEIISRSFAEFAETRQGLSPGVQSDSGPDSSDARAVTGGNR